MSVTSLMTKAVTLLEPVATTADAFGQPEVTLTAHVVLCHYRRIYSDDIDGVTMLPMDTLELYLPADTVIDGDWVVELDGERYEVQGEVQRRWNARLARVEYLSVLLRRAGL